MEFANKGGLTEVISKDGELEKLPLGPSVICPVLHTHRFWEVHASTTHVTADKGPDTTKIMTITTT